MADSAVTDGDVGHLAKRADIAGPIGLILRSKQQRISGLGKTAPVILHDVAFEQDALGVFEFKEVLYDKWIACRTAHISRLALQPCEGFEHMITPDFDIGGRKCRSRAPEQYILPRRFKEISH